MNDSAVVLLRHFNDVDHIAPIVITTANCIPVKLVLRDSEAFSHPLINYLRTTPGVVDIVPLAVALNVESDTDAREAVTNGEFALEDLISGIGGRPVVVLDWDYTEFAFAIVTAATSMGLTTVSLPHGDAPYINLMINVDDIDGTLSRWYGRADMYDHTAVPNELCAIRYPQLSPGRLHVLGSPRYNSKWLTTIDQLDPAPPFLSGRSGRRVAMFLRNANFPVYWEEVERAIDIVVASGNVDLVVKHHTRVKRMEELLNTHAKLATSDGGCAEYDSHSVVMDEISSRSLLDWADMVIDLGTSIAFEAVLKSVAVVCLEYAHANRSTIAEYFPTTDLRCRDDLVAVLQCFHEGSSPALITREEIEHFQYTIIEPAGRDVLSYYAELLCTAEQRRR